jgi:hypothetical protein
MRPLKNSPCDGVSTMKMKDHENEKGGGRTQRLASCIVEHFD